jgi:hypothetical protein
VRNWGIRPSSAGPTRSLIAVALGLVLLIIAVQGHGPSILQAQSTGSATATVTSTATGTVIPATSTPTPTPTSAGASLMTAPTATPQAAGTPGPARGDEDNLPPLTSTEESPGGGPQNRIVVINRSDNRLRVRAKVQLNHMPGDSVSPTNYAEAFSSCDGCQTFAVALQIDLISRDASQITPQNAAIALNYQCNSCHTIARASQYVIQVDDPNQVPDRVRDLVNDMNHELNRLASEHSVNDVTEAEGVLNNVMANFQDLAQSLMDQRDESVDPTTPGASPSP